MKQDSMTLIKCVGDLKMALAHIQDDHSEDEYLHWNYIWDILIPELEEVACRLLEQEIRNIKPH